MITVVIGIVIALLGLAHLTGNRAAGSKVASVALCLVAVGFGIFEVSHVNDRIAGLNSDIRGLATVGIGLWAMIVGAIVAGLGALSLRKVG